jgi:hypothetical protein
MRATFHSRAIAPNRSAQESSPANRPQPAANRIRELGRLQGKEFRTTPRPSRDTQRSAGGSAAADRQSERAIADPIPRTAPRDVVDSRGAENQAMKFSSREHSERGRSYMLFPDWLVPEDDDIAGKQSAVNLTDAKFLQRLPTVDEFRRNAIESDVDGPSQSIKLSGADCRCQGRISFGDEFHGPLHFFGVG